MLAPDTGPYGRKYWGADGVGRQLCDYLPGHDPSADADGLRDVIVDGGYEQGAARGRNTAIVDRHAVRGANSADTGLRELPIGLNRQADRIPCPVS